LGFYIAKKVPDGIAEVIESIQKNVFLNPDDKKYKNI